MLSLKTNLGLIALQVQSLRPHHRRARLTQIVYQAAALLNARN